MSIRERRLDKAINTILKEELQKGNLPSSKEFVWKLNQYLQQKNINGPELEFKPVRAGSVARSSDVNQTFDSVYSDFDTLYVSVIEQHNASLKHFNKFDVEKAKLDYQINQLENQLKELILLYGESGYLNSVYDMFTDFTQVDNAKTNTSIDIRQHEVKIPDIQNKSKKVAPLGTAKFEVLPGIKSLVEGKSISGTPLDAINDNANTTWQYEINTPNKMDVGGYYTLSFSTKQEVNKITLSLQSIKSTYIKPEFSPDNINWVSLPYYEKGVNVESEYTFDFPSIEMLQFRVLMGKTEPDGETLGKIVQEAATTDTATSFKITTEDDGNYYGTGTTAQKAQSINSTYLFGIKKISFYKNIYATEGVFQSTTLTVDRSNGKNFTIDKVALQVEEELPNGTEIKYFIALPPASGEPDWKAISPVNRKNPQYDQMIDFKNINTSVPNLFKIDPSISIGEYEQESMYANGIRFYKIGEIEDRQIIEGTERLFVGKNTWGKKSYSFQHADHTTHVPILSDWTKPNGAVSINYIKIEDGKPGILLNKEKSSTPMNYLFTLGVFSSKAKEIVSATPVSTDPISIYHNGQLLFQGVPTPTTKISYLFESGWNEIVVLVYTSLTAGTVNGATVDINLDPRKYGSSIYSKAKPLTRVSIFDLRYNTLNIDYDKFAVVEVNNKSQIILNHAISGLEYEFYYSYIDGAVKDQILLKAELSRDDTVTNTSPKIKSYRLSFS